MTFDETELTLFVNDCLSRLGRPTYPADEILNIVDMIWDFYETRGLLDLDHDEEPERSEIEPEIIDCAVTLHRRDKKSVIAPEDVPLIVRFELDYEDMILANPD